MKEIIEVPRAGKTPSKVIVGDVITSLKSFLPEKRVIIITDPNLHRRYKTIINEYEYLLTGLGEENKTLAAVNEIYRNLILMGADRHTFILGVGGGIVTDVAGYAASTYMRGVDFGFVATSLLAQVDASIGGKNGVNVDGYKNMVGTFNQPDFVLCDTSMLGTLPDREFRTGLAEIVKAAVIADPGLFSLLENASPEQLRSDKKLLREVITSAIRVKAAIVEADEKEGGVRKLLNLGHTFAHAIEKSSNLYTHGEAVAVGLAMISDISVRLGLLGAGDCTHIKGLLERLGLPVSANIGLDTLLKAVAKDKKRVGDSLDLVLPSGVGRCEIRTIPLADIRGYI